MRSEVVRRGVMGAVVVALVLLIVVTPSLIGRPAVLSAIPALIVGLTGSEVVIDVHGAVDHYMYRRIALELQGEDDPSFRLSEVRNDTYDLQARFPRNASAAVDLYVLIVDRQGTTFALNATVFHSRDAGGDVVSMTDRETLRTFAARPPGDVRALVPRGEGG